MERLFTTSEAGALLRVHPQTIRAMRRDGRLTAVLVGERVRYRSSDLEALVKPAPSAAACEEPDPFGSLEPVP